MIEQFIKFLSEPQKWSSRLDYGLDIPEWTTDDNPSGIFGCFYM